MVGKWYSYIQYLIQKADASLANVTNDSIIAKLLAKNGTVANFDDTTDSLEAIADTVIAIEADTGTGGVVLGTKAAAFKKLVGERQIATTTEDLNVGAGTLDLFTGTTQAVLLTALTIKMPAEAAGGSVTSIAIATDDATPGVIFNSTEGDVANLTSEAELSWTGAMRINVGTKIQLALAGGAHGSSYVTTITAVCEAIVDGGYLAESA